MKRTFKNAVDQQYFDLLEDILKNGNTVEDERTGTGTLSVFGRTLRFNMQEGLPVITTKKMYFKGIIGELLWFLGNHLNEEKYKPYPVDNIKYLVDNNINIWNGDLYKSYRKFCESEVTELNVSDVLVLEGESYRPLTEEEFKQRIKSDSAFYSWFVFKFGNLGPGYGWQWRNFNGDYKKYISSLIQTTKERHATKHTEINNNPYESREFEGVDQIKQVIEKLKTNPFDRRLIVTAWNPSDIESTVLPPCHYGFSFYVRKLRWEERVQWCIKNTDVEIENLAITHKILEEDVVPKYALSLMERQRSVDTFLGLPFNITSYAILLELIAREVNMVADELIMSLENTHLYLNHLPAVREQLERTESFSLPAIKVVNDKSIFDLKVEDIQIKGYQSGEKISATLNN